MTWRRGAAVQAALFSCATLSHPRRTERPFRHLICDQDAPSLRRGRRSSARSARASCAALFDSTNAPRARQPSSQTRGRDITSSFFLREGKDARGARGAAAARGERRADGKSIWMIPASLSSC